MAYFTIEGYNSYSGCDITVTASLPPINGQIINKYYTLGSLQTLSISTHQDKRPVRSLGVINAKDYVTGPRTIAGSMVFAVFNKHFATEIMNDLGASGGLNVILPDEIPALNITINFANEYGRMSRMAIYGVKIINEGQVMSINDLYTENTYQFVALGLEPLNINIDTDGDTLINSPQANNLGSAEVPATPGAEGVTINQNNQRNRGLLHGYNGKDLVVLDYTNSTEALLQDKNFIENSGANISEQIQNNNKIDRDNIFGLNATTPYNPIVLSAKVEQPRSKNDSGFVIFTLTPEQNQGIIYIYPVGSEDKILESYIILGERKNLITTLAAGNYQAQYVNSNSETSNTVRFVINNFVEVQTSEHIDNYPIIEKVTNNSIVISNTNYTHNTVVFFEEGHAYNKIPLNKNTTVISNLKPNTEYKILTMNDHSSSQIVSVRTYEIDIQEIIMFNNFIDSNKSYMMSDLKDLDFKYKSNQSLIDMVLDLPESHAKQELLIYAVELSNQLMLFHNKDNPNYMVDNTQEDPFDTKISLVNYDRVNVYNNINGRVVYNTALKNSEEETFYVKPNTIYSLCGITEKGEKSVKRNIVACKASSAEELENYRRTNLHKNLDLTEYLNRYNTFIYSTIEALAIRDKHYSDINILQPPYIYKEDDTIYANVNYLNLNRNNNYYLCYSEIYSALDYYPKRKIRFTLDDIEQHINLSDHYIGLHPKKKYLFWIEDYRQIRISKSYLYMDYALEEYKEVQSTYKQEMHSKLINIKKDLIRAYGNTTVINDIFNYVSGMQPNQIELCETLITEIINNTKNSYYVHDTVIPLYELLKIIHTYDTVSNLPKIEIDYKNKTVCFKDLKDYYICAIEYTESNQNIGMRLVEKDNMVVFGDSGYTLIYLTSYDMVYKTGFILMDNKNNTFVSTQDLADYIKEVGDK